MDREKLILAGVDYDEGVERFGGSPAIYEKYLRKFFAGGYMAAIQRQLRDNDLAGAFRSTHDLKSVLGNLSLQRCYAAVCELTELLRGGADGPACEAALQRAYSAYEQAESAAGEAAS